MAGLFFWMPQRRATWAVRHKERCTDYSHVFVWSCHTCVWLHTDLLGLNKFELHATSSPGYEVAISGVIQQRDQELPELQRATALVRRAITIDCRLLLHFTLEEEERQEVKQCGETFLPDGDRQMDFLFIMSSKTHSILFHDNQHPGRQTVLASCHMLTILQPLQIRCFNSIVSCDC